MKIGTVEIEGRVALAPMAGVTDRAFRQICQSFGAAYTVTEMVSAKALEFGDKKTKELADLTGDEGPVWIQIFGDDPQVMANSAKKLLAFHPQGIDINMGCPVPKVAGNGAGSALLKDPARCGEIVAAVRDAVDVPVTVKIRSGWDLEHVNAVEVAHLCERAGAAAVCVHARTRDQMYRGKADWDVIRRVKEAVGIPVIGNGDVKDAQSACLMLDQTGCDMALVGRGALGNPWVFRQINAYLTDLCRILPPPSLEERLLVLRRHIALLCAYKGENRGMREARKHVGWYLYGMRGAAQFRSRAGQLSALNDLDALLEDVYAQNSQNRQKPVKAAF